MRTVACLPLLLGLPLLAAPPATGEGPWVVVAHYRDRSQVAAFAARQEPWEVHRDGRYVVADVDRDGWQLLEDLGFHVQVDARRTAMLLKPPLRPAWQTDAIPGYPCYRTVEETHAAAAALAAANPALATWIDVGDTWEKQAGSGGYDLHVLRLTNAAVAGPKPGLFVMSAIHAREYATAELMTRYAEWLVSQHGVDADVTWILDHHVVHLLLQSNPDGRKRAESGQYWRKNADNLYCANSSNRGIDLNRNFVFRWGCCGGSSGQQCDETYRGPSAGSEPETQAVQSYVRASFPDQWNYPTDPSVPVDATGVFLDVHSYGELVLWPWGFTQAAAPNGPALQTLGRRFAWANGYYPEQAIELYPTDGTTDDFGYGDLGLAAYTFEIGNDFFQDCGTFTSSILPDNLVALTYAAKVARTPYLTPAGPESRSVVATPATVTQGDPYTVTATVDDTRFSNANGTEATQIVTAAEVYVDVPPWAAPGSGIAMTAADGAFDEKVEGVTATLSSAALAAGRHILFVRGRDAQGSDGPVSAVFLTVQGGTTGTIAGTVREAGTGLPLVATVVAGAFQTTSASTGAYALSVPAATYTVTATAPGHALVTVPSVVVTAGQTTTVDFDLPPLCTLLADDGESGAGTFVATSPWALSTESSSSPTHAWSDSPGGFYADGTDAAITSATLDLSAYTGVTLTFDHTYDLETGHDHGLVEASTDGGGTWGVLGSYSGYGHTTWATETVAAGILDGAAAARLRFRLVADAGMNADGWHVDDVRLEGSGASCGSTITGLDAISGQGPGPASPNRVRVHRGNGTATGVDFLAYGAGRWGANAAAGDLDGPAHDEIVTGPGPGDIFGPHVKGFRRDGTHITKVNFYAYGTLRYGVNAGAGRVDGDAFAEILSGPGPGVVFGPHVRGFDVDGGTAAPITRLSYYAYGTLRYGVRAVASRLDADAFDEPLTAPGPGPVFAPTIRGWNYDGVTVTPISKVNFDAFAALRYGAVIAAGDVDADGFAEIAATPGPGPTAPYASRFVGFGYDGASVAALPGFDVTPAIYTSLFGGHVALGDLAPDGRADLLTAAGSDPAAPPDVLLFGYDGTALTQLPGGFQPFTPGHGVNLAAGALGL